MEDSTHDSYLIKQHDPAKDNSKGKHNGTSETQASYTKSATQCPNWLN